jgi:hypothetical protein
MMATMPEYRIIAFDQQGLQCDTYLLDAMSLAGAVDAIHRRLDDSLLRLEIWSTEKLLAQMIQRPDVLQFR